MNDIITDEIRKLIPNTEFLYVPSHSDPRKLRLLEDGNAVDPEVRTWSVTYHEKNQRAELRLDDEEGMIGVMALDHQGNWKGRSRKRGAMALRHESHFDDWAKMANPSKFFKERPVEDDTDDFHYLEALAPQVDWEPYEYNLAEFLDTEKIPNSSTAIAVVANDRPAYFQRTLQSLGANAETLHRPIFIFFDLPAEPKNVYMQDEQAKLARQVFPNAVIIRRPRNFGCGRNLIDVRRQLFDNMRYEQVFIFEDDMVVSPHYIRLCEALMKWGRERYTNIGAVQAWRFCDLSAKEKRRYSSYTCGTYSNWWGYLMCRQAWEAIREKFYKYEKLFLGSEYHKRPNRTIHEWFRRMREGRYDWFGKKPFPVNGALRSEMSNYFSGPPTGQDAATMHLLHCAGFMRLTTVVNRGEYIGQQGIHMNPRMFKKHGYDRVTLDNVVGDEVLSSFVIDLPGEVVKEEALAGMPITDAR